MQDDTDDPTTIDTPIKRGVRGGVASKLALVASRRQSTGVVEQAVEQTVKLSAIRRQARRSVARYIDTLGEIADGTLTEERVTHRGDIVTVCPTISDRVRAIATLAKLAGVDRPAKGVQINSGGGPIQVVFSREDSRRTAS